MWRTVAHMAIDDRRGTCATCNGPIRRVPYPDKSEPDRWVHNRTADWIDNPHEAQPIPTEEVLP